MNLPVPWHYRLRVQSSPPEQPLSTSPGENDVKLLEEITPKYGYARADEVAGPDNSRAFFDYGSPVVVADSSARDSSRASRTGVLETARWARTVQRD
jgi:hypothetical protein